MKIGDLVKHVRNYKIGIVFKKSACHGWYWIYFDSHKMLQHFSDYMVIYESKV